MRFALFCDGTYSLTTVAIEVAQVHATMSEVEAVRAVVEVVAVARRRTPIVAVVTSIVERGTVTVTRSRKEDTTAVWSYKL